MALSSNFTEVYAIPGKNHIIDAIDPATGLTMINGHTEEQVKAREPQAERMTYEAWQAAAVARQQTPITWGPTTREQYHEMLGILPPAFWKGGVFCVGEPTDHDFATGRPRFATYRYHGGEYQVASRPLTRAEAAEHVQQPRRVAQQTVEHSQHS